MQAFHLPDAGTKSYYEALRSEENISFASIESKLDQNTSLGRARWGAFKMKCSKFESTPLQKLETFKQGRNALEQEIKQHQMNVEYRFLRLVIQEHVPSYLRYKSNIEEDAEFIVTHFDLLPKPLQGIVLNYASKSNALTAEKLQ